MKAITLLTVLILSSCYNQPEFLGEKTFDLEQLSFNFNARKFYSKTINESWTSYYKALRKNSDTIIQFYNTIVDTVDSTGFNSYTNSPFAIQYNNRGLSLEDNFITASFEGLDFLELNAMTDLNNNLMLISAYNDSISTKKMMSTIKILNKKYGHFELTKSRAGFTKYSNKTWLTKDRVIQIVSDAQPDFSGVILSKKQKGESMEIINKKLTNVHLFICKKKYVDKIKGKMTQDNWLNFD